MSETAVPGISGEALLAAAGLKGKAAAPDHKKETEASVDSTGAPDASEAHLQDAAAAESASPQSTGDEPAARPAQGSPGKDTLAVSRLVLGSMRWTAGHSARAPAAQLPRPAASASNDRAR